MAPFIPIISLHCALSSPSCCLACGHGALWATGDTVCLLVFWAQSLTWGCARIAPSLGEPQGPTALLNRKAWGTAWRFCPHLEDVWPLSTEGGAAWL